MDRALGVASACHRFKILKAECLAPAGTLPRGPVRRQVPTAGFTGQTGTGEGNPYLGKPSIIIFIVEIHHNDL